MRVSTCDASLNSGLARYIEIIFDSACLRMSLRPAKAFCNTKPSPTSLLRLDNVYSRVIHHISAPDALHAYFIVGVTRCTPMVEASSARLLSWESHMFVLQSFFCC